VNVHCVCPPEIAAARFANRKRHDGHLDAAVVYENVLKQLRLLSTLGSFGIADRLEVNTSAAIESEALSAIIGRCASS